MELIRDKDRTLELVVSCRLCHEVHRLKVRPQDFEAYNEGAHCQDAFPYLSADDRELLISRTCGKCWSKIFSDDNTEDE